MAQCRDDKCLMGFSSEKQRNAHENLMHKTLMDDLLLRVVKKVIAQNSVEKINKKIVKTTQGNISYQEALNILNEPNSDRKKDVTQTLMPVVSSLLAANPSWTAREILSVPEFKISQW